MNGLKVYDQVVHARCMQASCTLVRWRCPHAMHGRSRTTSDCLCWKNEKKSVHAYTQYTAKKANGKESREKGVQISVSCEGFEGRLSLLGPFNRPSCHPRCLSYLDNSFWTSVITVSASLGHLNSQPVPPQPTHGKPL